MGQDGITGELERGSVQAREIAATLEAEGEYGAATAILMAGALVDEALRRLSGVPLAGELEQVQEHPLVLGRNAVV